MPNYYDVEKNVPVAKMFKPPGRWGKLANKMRPGDSVLLKTASEAGCLAIAIKTRAGHAVTRKVSDGFRVWRLEPEERESKKVFSIKK